jgi:hypothetical protein
MHRVAWAVTTAADQFPRIPTCLVKALAADTMLRRRRFPSMIRFGVREPDVSQTPLEAHAWVECGGNIILGRIDDLHDYTVLSAAKRS